MDEADVARRKEEEKAEEKKQRLCPLPQLRLGGFINAHLGHTLSDWRKQPIMYRTTDTTGGETCETSETATPPTAQQLPQPTPTFVPTHKPGPLVLAAKVITGLIAGQCVCSGRQRCCCRA
jgi:hypothetical protein